MTSPKGKWAEDGRFISFGGLSKPDIMELPSSESWCGLGVV